MTKGRPSAPVVSIVLLFGLSPAGLEPVALARVQRRAGRALAASHTTPWRLDVLGE